MQDTDNSRQQLAAELAVARRKIGELERQLFAERERSEYVIKNLDEFSGKALAAISASKAGSRLRSARNLLSSSKNYGRIVLSDPKRVLRWQAAQIKSVLRKS